MKTFKPMLWTKPAVNGTRHLKIYIGEGRKIDFFPLKIFVLQEKINDVYMRWVDNKVTNATRINVFIKETLDRFQALDMTHPGVSIKELIELFNNKDILDFYDFFDNDMRKRENLIKPATLVKYKQLKLHLLDYSPKLDFNKIDLQFIEGFQSHMKREEMKQTTIYKMLTIFKMVIASAINEDKIVKNPFYKFKLKNGHYNRTFLDKAILNKIKDLEGLSNYENEARQKFLFQCYTGLAFSDLISLKWSDIRGDVIHKERLKTNRPLVIPIISQASEIISLTPKVNDFVFSKISNQKYNEYLHLLEARAELTIPLTSHVARHTFATLALEQGVRIEVVSSILGHTSIKTTQIYGKITKKLKEEEMRKLRF